MGKNFNYAGVNRIFSFLIPGLWKKWMLKIIAMKPNTTARSTCGSKCVLVNGNVSRNPGYASVAWNEPRKILRAATRKPAPDGKPSMFYRPLALYVDSYFVLSGWHDTASFSRQEWASCCYRCFEGSVLSKSQQLKGTLFVNILIYNTERTPGDSLLSLDLLIYPRTIQLWQDVTKKCRALTVFVGVKVALSTWGCFLYADKDVFVALFCTTQQSHIAEQISPKSHTGRLHFVCLFREGSVGTRIVPFEDKRLI